MSMFIEGRIFLIFRYLKGPFTFPAFCFESCTALALNHFCRLHFILRLRADGIRLHLWHQTVTFDFNLIHGELILNSSPLYYRSVCIIYFLLKAL